jgi:hypothetical protein
MINLKLANIAAFITLFLIGGLIAGRQEMKARELERKIRERHYENLAKVPFIEEKLKSDSLSQDERKKLENELEISKRGLPNIPHYFPYNQRIIGWPLGIALMIGGVTCLFVKNRVNGLQ